MTDAREQAFIIKGYLHAKEAPAPLLAGIEIILSELASTQATVSARIPINNIGDIASRFLSRRASAAVPGDWAQFPEKKIAAPALRSQEKPEHQADHIPNVTKMVSAQLPDNIGEVAKAAETAAGDHIVDADKMVVEDTDVPNKVEISMISEKKQRKSWSPEARAAAGERMRARIAAGKMGKKSVSTAPAAEPKKPFTPVPIDKLQADHNEYVGDRDEEGELLETDLPDIRAMLSNGMPKSRIARSYRVEEQYLDAWLEQRKNIKIDKATPRGNF